ncbi:MAG: GIY-YIG nuclease family protein [Candidatus Omnitrophica bacterium]|nr:GIY-YIG nuclease family protein [Candidatus Omnitrophota bacterium]
MWYLYILECADRSLYTGIALDVRRRVREHASGKGSRYTRSRLPVRLVYEETCGTRSWALKREVRVKRLTRRQKLDLVKSL